MKPRIRARGAIASALLASAMCLLGGSSVTASPSARTPQLPTAQASGPGATYVPISPARLADTRRPFGSSIAGRLPAGATTSIQITGRSEAAIPATATAVVLNVTIDNASNGGYATVYPAGIARPDASNLNYSRVGYTGANLVTVKIGSGGAVNVFTDQAATLIVDVFGYYAPAAGAVSAGRIEPVTPDRLYDTRGIGSPLGIGEYRTVTLPRVPAGATGVVLNYTVTGTTRGGYFSILPPSQRPAAGEPSTSNINVVEGGATIANQAILPITSGNQVTLYTSAGGHVILDLFGYVTGPTAPSTTRGLFVPLPAPFRMFDTRTSNNNPLGPTLRMWSGWVADVNVAGRGGVPTSGVGAIVGNTTFVDSHGGGWLAAYAAGTTFPGTSNVNTYFAGQTVPNHTMSPVAARGSSFMGISVRAGDTGGHVIVDVSGYYLGTPVTSVLGSSTNVPPPPVGQLLLSIPSIGHQSWVQDDTTDAALTRGPGWWQGSAYPGVGGNYVVFGHRTDYGGPFRNLHLLQPGELITVEGDHRKVTYRIDTQPDGRAWFVIGAGQANQYVGPSGANQITLIACSQPNGNPTNLAYRIVVTATLVSYVNT